MSGIESAYIGAYIYDHVPFETFDFQEMVRHSGIQIVSENDWKEFVESTMNAMIHASLLAVWDGISYRQCESLYKYLEEQYPFIHTIPAHSLEPYMYMYQDPEHTVRDPEYNFPELFQNKKVLIITSHGDSVVYQIQRHFYDIFHPFTIFHPTTMIQVYKCTQQNGVNGDGYGWKGHYLKMCYDISQYDFDVAFIGCGGFSNLLGYYIYNTMRKSAIYVGGPIQIYFGIMGKRWTMHPTIQQFLSKNGDTWIQPLTSDEPIEKNATDHGCYWI